MKAWTARGVVIGAALLLTLAVVPRSEGRPAAASTLSYVALGDSYTSGPLVLPHDTTWVPQDCAQSIRNYPHLAAVAIGATSFTDVSCGSATLDDLYEPQDGLPLGGVNAPQLEAVDQDTDVVTLGMGGNDVGFVGAALDCIRLLGPPLEEPCTPAYTAGGVDSVAAAIADVGPELGQALRDIHTKAPNAEIFVVSYPAALPDNGVACWPYVPILQADMPYLVAKFKEMNAMLAEQAAANDATYIDIYTSSIGHDACQLPVIAWVNGVVVVPPSYPAHPNQLGLANSGAAVAAAVQQRLAAVERDAPPAPTPSVSPTPSRPATLPATGGSADPTLAVLLVLLVAAGAAAMRRDGIIRP